MSFFLKTSLGKVVRSLHVRCFLPWYHPDSPKFWGRLWQVRTSKINPEETQVIFQGPVTPELIKQLARPVRVQSLPDHGKSREPSGGLPWYHPEGRQFWDRISRVEFIDDDIVLVFSGEGSLPDGFRELLRERRSSVLLSSESFLATTEEVVAAVRQWHDEWNARTPHPALNFWAQYLPEEHRGADWREHVIEQARIDCEMRRNKEQLKTLINEAFCDDAV